MVKKEVFTWLKTGAKTVEIRRGLGRKGEVAVFQCGPNHLRFKIIKRETAKLTQLVNEDTYLLIVPVAGSFHEAMCFLRSLYGAEDGLFTAYYLGQLQEKK